MSSHPWKKAKHFRGLRFHVVLSFSFLGPGFPPCRRMMFTLILWVGVWGGGCLGVGVWGWVCGGVWRPATTPSHTVTKVGSMMLPTLQKHMEKHVAAPSLENSGLNLTNSQLSSPPQAAVRTSTRCQSSLTSVQSEVLQHMAPGRKKSLSKLPAKKKTHLHSLV